MEERYTNKEGYMEERHIEEKHMEEEYLQGGRGDGYMREKHIEEDIRGRDNNIQRKNIREKNKQRIYVQKVIYTEGHTKDRHMEKG